MPQSAAMAEQVSEDAATVHHEQSETVSEAAVVGGSVRYAAPGEAYRLRPSRAAICGVIFIVQGSSGTLELGLDRGARK